MFEAGIHFKEFPAFVNKNPYYYTKIYFCFIDDTVAL